MDNNETRDLEYCYTGIVTETQEVFTTQESGEIKTGRFAGFPSFIPGNGSGGGAIPLESTNYSRIEPAKYSWIEPGSYPFTACVYQRPDPSPLSKGW